MCTFVSDNETFVQLKQDFLRDFGHVTWTLAKGSLSRSGEELLENTVADPCDIFDQKRGNSVPSESGTEIW